MRRLTLSISMLFLLTQAAAADVVFVERQETTQPGGLNTQTMTIKIKGTKARIDIGEMISTIMDHATGTSIGLMHMSKEYKQSSKSAEKEGLEMALNQMKGKIPAERPRLVKTDEKKVVNGWLAEKYTAQGPDLKLEYWIAPELARFQPAMEMMHDPMFDPISKQFPDVKAVAGLPVITIMDRTVGSMHMKTTITMTSIREEPVPDSAFTIPAGYSKAEP
jgi:Domain of unknown function (DUF4412)